MPARDAQWIIGTLVAVAIALSMQINTQTSNLRSDMNQRFNEVNQRFREVDQRFSEVNRRLEGFDERLRNVEIAFGKVDQRLELLERVVLPADARTPD